MGRGPAAGAALEPPHWTTCPGTPEGTAAASGAPAWLPATCGRPYYRCDYYYMFPAVARLGSAGPARPLGSRRLVPRGPRWHRALLRLLACGRLMQLTHRAHTHTHTGIAHTHTRTHAGRLGMRHPRGTLEAPPRLAGQGGFGLFFERLCQELVHRRK